MRSRLSVLAICLIVVSCDSNVDLSIKPDSLIGFWSRETVYLNGTNSNEYVDFLNGGTNFLEIKENTTFSRAYDNGSWQLSNQTLNLERDEATGLGDWSYKIIELSNRNLILEIKLTESQYCCGFDSFSDNEIITIKEVYTKIN
jgi:hypothetical protein